MSRSKTPSQFLPSRDTPVVLLPRKRLPYKYGVSELLRFARGKELPDPTGNILRIASHNQVRAVAMRNVSRSANRSGPIQCGLGIDQVVFSAHNDQKMRPGGTSGFGQ